MSIGQKVKYYPMPDDETLQLLNDRHPCDAVVVSMNGDSADLNVTDHFGHIHFVPAVPIHSSGIDYCSVV